MARRPLHPVVQARAFRRLLRVRSLIAEHYSEQLTLAGMARHAGLSRFHLLRTYRRVFGATPRAHLRATRLAAARRLLKTGARVTEACFAVGFASLGSFSSAFRRDGGVAPAAWRRAALAASVADQVPWCMLCHAGLADPRTGQLTAAATATA
jgi:AraC-like DNA-binding protein